MSDFTSAFDDDVLSLLGQPTGGHEMQVVAILDRYARDLIDYFRQQNPNILVSSAHYGDDLKMFLEGADIVVIECRLMEGFQDLRLINAIRQARPLVPIVAISANLDHDFVLAAYENGVYDYLSYEISVELLLAKLRTIKRVSEAAVFLETKNQEVLDTMRSLRTSKEKLKSEINSRINAETQREFAEELAAVNQQNKEILDNLREGFFIVGRNLRIHESTSASCQDIFGSDISSQPLGQVLGLQDDKEGFIKLTLEQVFEDFMPQSVSLGMLPARVRTQDGKILDLKYTVIQDKAGKPDKVIVVAEDVTEHIKRQEQHEKQMQHVQCLFTIVQNIESFKEFLYDFKRDLESLRTTRQRETAFRILHTIKGNAGVYQLEFLSKRVHAIETLVSEKQPNDSVLFSYMAKVASDLETKFRDFLARNGSILGVTYEDSKREVYTVTARQVFSLMSLARDADKGTKNRLIHELETLRYRPLRVLTSPLHHVVKRTAGKLDKKIKLSITGDGYRADLEALTSLFSNLVHLINNACDHGIEEVSMRRKRKKPVTGHLTLDLVAGDHGLVISLRDDGQGIDPKKILAVAERKQLLSKEKLSSLKREEILNLIFLDGFSTSDRVSDTSGRGVGMSAVKAEVEKLDGRIFIDTVEGKGTTFKLLIPGIVLLNEQGEAA